MSSTKTIKETLDFAANELKSALIRNAVVRTSTGTASVDMTVRRTFVVEGTITVDFQVLPQPKTGSCSFKPRVSVNFPACNKDIVRAAAFMQLVNELVPLAASLQAQLDEIEVISE